MKKKNFNRLSIYIFCLAFFIVWASFTQTYAQAKIDPISPIVGINWEANNKVVDVTVELRQLPKDSTKGIPAKSFVIGNLRSTTNKQFAKPKPSSDGKSIGYKIEISSNPNFGENFRISRDWAEFIFFVEAKYRKDGDTEDTPYTSPRFTIVRKVQLPTININPPKWQAETINGNTKTQYIAVTVTPSESMKLDIRIDDGAGTVAQQTNVLIGSEEARKVILKMQPNASIVIGRDYKVKAIRTGKDNLSAEIDWKPTSFLQHYRLSDSSETNLSAIQSIEGNKATVEVTTRTVGQSLKLIPKVINPNKVKLISNDGTNWKFEVDLAGAPQSIIPFHFEGTGGNPGDPQVFDGRNKEGEFKEYFFRINNDSKIVSPLSLNFDKDKQMIIKYKLNRPIPSHRLLLTAPGITLTDLPAPKLDAGKTSDYTITAKSEVAKLLTALSAKLKSNGNTDIPVTFKLMDSSEGTAKPIVEFQLSAYGVTSADYLKKVTDITTLLGRKDRYKKPASALTAILNELGLKTPPADGTNEKRAIDAAVNLLTTEKDKEKRSKGFWAQFGSAALKIVPKLIGLPIGLE